ncbi:hypothetical protein [Streptomyces sp. NPDC004296]|uniref:hypothetical protein n=1 Tax=Streptomyces sp. NPDC004296 TaxID=3364697 RepID=UPI003692ADEC
MIADTFAARPWCVDWHWCSWLEKLHRGSRPKDPWDEPYTGLVSAAQETNRR